MRDLIQKTIEVLKEKVKKNLEQINQNQLIIKDILRKSSSTQRSVDFEKHYQTNKVLLSENNDFINIQLTLINFLEKYKNTAVFEESQPIVDISSITDDQELLDLTVKEILQFNEMHPKFKDQRFVKQLIKHYQEIEEYEKCQELIDKMKKW